MSRRGVVVDRPGARALLGLLGDAPRTGDALAAACGIDAVAFRQQARALWTAKLIQGAVPDGCCHDPCGIACISAMQPSRPWMLSRKGRSTLTRLTDEDAKKRTMAR